MTRHAVTALMLVTTGAVAAPAAADDAAVMAIVQRHCKACHAARPTHPAFAETPKNVVLESPADVKKHAKLIIEQTVEGRAMPLGNETGMTDAERAALGEWLRTGK